MSNPYAAQPDFAFWRRSVANLPAAAVDPVCEIPFHIGKADRVATAGSCFAQHIARTLLSEGFNYDVTEQGPLTPGARDESYGLFPARFGNIYTVRQLLQLFQRAYGLFEPVDVAWGLKGGGHADPFRPRIQQGGFHSVAELLADREVHYACVRRMFDTCDVFIFTLGLTEGWVSATDGAVFPLAPGVSGTLVEKPDSYRFENFSVAAMTADLLAFIDLLRTVNPRVRLVFTVSPVPLIATFEKRHVLVSTIYSKSALRVVAEEATQARPLTAYFPSYEIITGPQARGHYFRDDLREITTEGVARVMELFKLHFLRETAELPAEAPPSPTPRPHELAKQPRVPPQIRAQDVRNRLLDNEGVICDEEALDPPDAAPQREAP